MNPVYEKWKLENKYNEANRTAEWCPSTKRRVHRFSLYSYDHDHPQCEMCGYVDTTREQKR